MFYCLNSAAWLHFLIYTPPMLCSKIESEVVHDDDDDDDDFSSKSADTSYVTLGCLL